MFQRNILILSPRSRTGQTGNQQEAGKKQRKLLAYTSTLKTQAIYFKSSGKTAKQNKGCYYLEVTFSRNSDHYNIN
jgi:hypothetical protein